MPMPMHHHQRGITLLEVLMSITIMALAAVGLFQLADQYGEDVRDAVAADHLRRTANASQAYIKDNYTAISAVAGPAAPYYIDMAALVAGGYLPPGTPAANGFKQSTCVLVLQPVANKLQAMVVTEGGSDLDDARVAAVANLAGGSAGSVQSISAARIKGAQGGWDIPVASYHNLVNNAGKRCDGTGGNVQVTTGHNAVALWFENGNYQSATLYRDPVPGHPELNTMNTPILMASVQTASGACVTNGAIARDANGAVLSCQGGLWKSQGSAFWQDPVANYASLPACNAAAAGQTRVVSTPTTGTGPRAYTCDGAAWKALALNDSGNLSMPGTLTTSKVALNDTVTAGAACSPNGLVAKDATGLLLSCQSGVWRPSVSGCSRLSR